MSIYNTTFDSANTAVRAFLTKVGEYYLGRSFNTSSGQAKKDWLIIKNEVFNSKCVYCGQQTDALQMEHLIMFNKIEYGLHHPGNIVPCCKVCNTRRKKADNSYMSWEEHLYKVCEDNNTLEYYEERRNAILRHMNDGKFKYPCLSNEEKNAIKIIADSLYENIKLEVDKSLNLFQNLQKAFIKSI
ncbi:MAG TPA: HNH endonuclease signature motif containing protein [Pseudobacteroides sp.]|nr:HNH endonuclease signature motif containing protein [Pseudobacteroides sp.]